MGDLAGAAIDAGAEIALLAMKSNRCLNLAVDALKEVAYLGDAHSRSVAVEAMRKIAVEMVDDAPR